MIYSLITICGIVILSSCVLADKLEEYQYGSYIYVVLNDGNVKNMNYESWMESPTTITIPEELDGHMVFGGHGR